MVTIHSKQVKITDALREHARRQAQQIQKMSKKILDVSFFVETVSKKHNDPRANKVVVQVRRPGKDIVVRSFATNLYEAISEASRAAARRLRKTRERKLHAKRDAHHKNVVDTSLQADLQADLTAQSFL